MSFDPYDEPVWVCADCGRSRCLCDAPEPLEIPDDVPDEWLSFPGLP